FNLDFGWFASDYLGIDQGPIAIMIENYLTGSVWERIRANQDVQTGLARAGFTQTSDAPGPVRQMEGVTLMSDPNPFSTETTVDYSIPRDAEVSLGLFTASGRKVRDLFQGERVAGDHRVQLDAQDLESGVYYFVLEVDGARMGRRCVLVR
ncbi:MAG: hypothetical protein KDA27_02410, partial [Candidatus Eisenbacteria bacterium]|nr:hypothetical protein [Candidatus Eisenbacteria bacterium]